MYWYFAHYFGFTPEQTDDLPYDRMANLINLENEFRKKEQDKMKNG